MNLTARLRPSILPLAIIGVGLFLSGLPAILLDRWLASWDKVGFALLWMLAFPHTFSYLILTPLPFYAFLLICFLAMLLAWFVSDHRWVRGLLLLGYAAAVIYIIAPPFHYRPPVKSVPGHILLVPTRPRTLTERIRWEYEQDWFEAPGCTYELLGWDDPAILFFINNRARAGEMWYGDSIPPAMIDRIPGRGICRDWMGRPKTLAPSTTCAFRRCILLRLRNLCAAFISVRPGCFRLMGVGSRLWCVLTRGRQKWSLYPPHPIRGCSVNKVISNQ